MLYKRIEGTKSVTGQSVDVKLSERRRFGKTNCISSLCCSFSPVVVDAVLELNDSKVSDLKRKASVKVSRLKVNVVALRLFP